VGLAELSERVEQIGLHPELAPFSRHLERADDDSRVRRRIAAKIDRPETTRTEVGTNSKRTERVRPMASTMNPSRSEMDSFGKRRAL
jgi:hypothetical protein